MAITFRLAALLLLVALAFCSSARPYAPDDDEQVLERLPEKADPSLADLKRLRTALASRPTDLAAAANFARRAIEAARESGDPRFLGQAQAALGPWWRLPEPPPAAMLLRATLKQSTHDFDGALVDLDRLIAARPADGQALLTRATVLSVQGRHTEARRDCQGIARLTSALVTAACDAAPASLSGQAENAYASLTIALEREPNAPASVREWALTLLAEIAARRGDSMAAETNFSAALALDPRDPYLLGAYSDFLLDRGRPDEAIRLLGDFTRNDSLLLRLALAEARVPALRRPFQTHRADLAARFDAARRRGDAVHRREEARYTLHIIHDAPAALALAQDNWRTQKEPADLRILLEAGAAANDSATLRDATAWIAVHHFEDVALAPALRRRG